MKSALRVFTLIAVLLVAAGCDVRYSRGGGGSASLHGTARIAHDGFPLAGAEVRLDGPARRVTTTSRSGSFFLTGLPEGRYTATLRALHGSYTTSVWVSGTGTLNWGVEPTWFDRELFYQLSGLKSYYVDSYGRLTWNYGYLVRWEQRDIRIYMDVGGAPYGFHPGWPDQYWHEVKRWESYLHGRVNFRRVFHPSEADTIVRWTPPGYLGDHAGMARHLAYYENGALRRVLIEIDVNYGGSMGLWAHELAHAMGLSHVTDPTSVMYPWMRHGQRNTLSTKEASLARLVYDIPSGQRLGGYYGMAAAEGSGDVGDSDVAGSLEPEMISGYRGGVVTQDGVRALDEDAVAQLLDAAWR